MIKYINIILPTLFYLIPSFICLYNLFKKKQFHSKSPFYNTWLVIYCFIPFSNFYEMIRIIFRMQYEVNTYDDLKKIPNIHYRLQFWLLIMGLVFSYFYLSQPYEIIVVNESAEIKGIDNKVRALLQGKRFWQNQLNRIKNELNRELKEPQRQIEEEQKIDQAVIKIELSLEEYYNKNPDKRPSLTKLKADELREKADQIEWNEAMRLLDRERLNRIAELIKILSIVQAKTNE